MAQPIKGQRPNRTPVPARWFAGQTPPGPSITVAVTDGTDIYATSVGPLVSVSSATTDGADVAVGNLSVLVAASSATTDGADVLASSISVLVSVSSATTDGADVAAASLSVQVDVSSATTDGGDIAVANVMVPVLVSVAVTEGTDIYATVLGPTVDVTSATTDGADICVANVSPVVVVAGQALGTGPVNMLVPSTFDKDSFREWAEWNLFHIISHQEITNAMMAAGKPVASYPLDYDEKNDNWKQVHNEEHASINYMLGLTPALSNLADVDFTDQSQFNNWMYNHALVHQQVKTALGL